MSNNAKQLYHKDKDEYKSFFPIVRLEDIIETITDKSIQWLFNNYNHIYVEFKESVAETRNEVPNLLRRNGLWITYNTGKELITEQYIGSNNNVENYKLFTDDIYWKRFDDVEIKDGSITLDKLSKEIKNLLGNIDIYNNPDEEDLTTIDNKLKIKDREYNKDNFSGLGHVILRKNIKSQNGKPINILTQDMINKPNTIYEIRYDFDLNGEEIAIPEECILEFNGGSLNNGDIISNNTILKAPIYQIFKTNLNIINELIADDYYSEWFGSKADGITDCTEAFQKSCSIFKSLKLLDGIYLINNTITITKCANIYGIGNNNKYNNSIIKFNNKNNNSKLFILNNETPYITFTNIKIEGTSPIINDAYYIEGSTCIDANDNCIYVYDCWIKNFDIIFNSNNNSYYNKIKNNRFEYFNVCVNYFSPNNLIIEDNRFIHFQNCINLGYGDGPTVIINNSFEVFNNRIVKSNQTGQCTFCNNYIEIWDNVKLPALFEDRNNGFFGGNFIFYGHFKTFTAINNEYQINAAKRLYYLTNVINFCSMNNHIILHKPNCNLEKYTNISGNVKNFICLDNLENIEIESDKYVDVTYEESNQIVGDDIQFISGYDPISGKKYITTQQFKYIWPNREGGWWVIDGNEPKAKKLNEGYCLVGTIKRSIYDSSIASNILADLSFLNIPNRNSYSVKYKTFNEDFEDIILEYNYETSLLSIVNGSTEKNINIDNIIIYDGY